MAEGDVESQQGFPLALASLGVLPHIISFLATGEGNLSSFRTEISTPDGWERFHSRYRATLPPTMAAQGLVLSTTVVFLTTSTPVPFVSYTDPKVYGALSFAFALSLAGLVFQFTFFAMSGRPAIRETGLTGSQAKMLTYLVCLRLPYIVFLFSLLFLTTGFLLSWPRTFTYLIAFVLFCGTGITFHGIFLRFNNWFAVIMSVFLVLMLFAYLLVVSLVPLDWS